MDLTSPKQNKPSFHDNHDNIFQIADRQYNSRLLVGTGKYSDLTTAAKAIKASGAAIITVAVRRVNLTANTANKDKILQDILTADQYTYLPNSAGCYTAAEAVRTLKLAREAGGWNMVKLEVIGDKKSLYPDVIETLKAARILVKDGFEVMAYTNDDPVTAKKLEDSGCAAIMPLAAPIGSGLGIQNRLNIEMIVKQVSVPVLVDAGIGTASDAAIAMEMGCDGVLINTAIAEAENPVMMAEAMKEAVKAGRLSYLAGRMEKRGYASASTKDEGKIG